MGAVIGRFWVHDVTIARPAVGADRYGDPTPDWAGAARTSTRGWLARQTTNEIRDGREEVVSEWLLSLPADTDVAGGDRIEAQGHTFEIVGDPEQAPTPRGPHHIVLHLQSVHG